MSDDSPAVKRRSIGVDDVCSGRSCRVRGGCRRRRTRDRGPSRRGIVRVRALRPAQRVVAGGRRDPLPARPVDPRRARLRPPARRHRLVLAHRCAAGRGRGAAVHVGAAATPDPRRAAHPGELRRHRREPTRRQCRRDRRTGRRRGRHRGAGAHPRPSRYRRVARRQWARRLLVAPGGERRRARVGRAVHGRAGHECARDVGAHRALRLRCTRGHHRGARRRAAYRHDRRSRRPGDRPRRAPRPVTPHGHHAS